MDYNTLTAENILRIVSQADIMQKYFPHYIEFGKKYTNPFRIDRKKGCYFAYSQRGNLTFFDNADSRFGGDCFKIAGLSLGISNFKDILLRINKDMNLGLKTGFSNLTPLREDVLARTIKTPNIKNNKIVEKLNSKKSIKFHYKVKARKWNRKDFVFWNKKYGISLKTLKRYNVFPVQTYSRRRWDEKNFKLIYDYEEEKEICYCFLFGKENQRVKLYRPESKTLKWVTNTSNCNVQGLEQLPINDIKEDEVITAYRTEVEKTIIKHELLIITSSMKDLLTLVENGFTAIAPQGEGIPIPKEIIEDLKTKFKKIIIMYDRDNAGINYANAHSTKYKLPFSILPNFIEYQEIKDFADYIELFKSEDEESYKERFIDMVNNMIEEAKYSK